MDNNATKHEGQALGIDTGQEKWQAQEVGVNSNVPLVDAGTGKQYIIRQFEFAFDPSKIKDIQKKKIPAPTRQELFNSNVRQIRMTLWGDGLVPREDVEPRMIIGKKKYKIILVCEPRLGVIVNDKARTLQEITKPKSLTS